MSLMQRTPSNLSLCMSPGGAPSAPIAIGRDDDDSPSGRGGLYASTWHGETTVDGAGRRPPRAPRFGSMTVPSVLGAAMPLLELPSPASVFDCRAVAGSLNLATGAHSLSALALKERQGGPVVSLTQMRRGSDASAATSSSVQSALSVLVSPQFQSELRRRSLESRVVSDDSAILPRDEMDDVDDEDEPRASNVDDDDFFALDEH